MNDKMLLSYTDRDHDWTAWEERIWLEVQPGDVLEGGNRGLYFVVATDGPDSAPRVTMEPVQRFEEGYQPDQNGYRPIAGGRAVTGKPQPMMSVRVRRGVVGREIDIAMIVLQHDFPGLELVKERTTIWLSEEWKARR